MQHSIRAIHFIGIGGAGMAGLAEVMAGLGYAVSGSDKSEQPSLSRLRARGVRVSIGHDAKQAADADCVVYSSAIGADNVERVAAVERGIPVVPRAQMLGELMRFKPGIAVAGTHGKTTVASMIAAILSAAKLSPTCVIGGKLLSLVDGELIGNGEHVVVEADESDLSFLHLQPVIAVVTNIDDDHLEAFGNDFNRLSEAFVSFLGNLPFYGTAVMCCDDAVSAAVADKIETKRVVRYGLSAGADFTAVDITVQPDGTAYTLVADGRYPMKVNALGHHNVQNALAATAVAVALNVPLSAVREGLASFAGVSRRLEFYGEIVIESRRALLIDDYAHHPSEIRATLAALRDSYPERRILLVFQPHRYSRTVRLLKPLAEALDAADALIVLPTYAAGEPMPDADPVLSLLPLLNTAAVYDSQQQRFETIAAQLQDGDLLVCMGAGDIGHLPAQLKEAYHG